MAHSFDQLTLSESFFNPLFELYPATESQHLCHELSDLDYLKLGVSRCISSAKSGNDFLQTYRKDDGQKVGVPHFFESLKSKRRLSNLASMNELMKGYLTDRLPDALQSIEELKKWHLFAADGHYHKAAIFDPKTKADLSRKQSNKSATGHFFRLDLRTHHLEPLDLAQPEDGKKSEHDLKMLKRQELNSLRGCARVGEKVLYLWDRACIDYAFWNKAKSQKGIYFCTLAKSNSVTEFIREHQLVDYDDSRSEGVISDRIVETSKGYEIRQICYTNPADGERYEYLTNELTLPGWVHVLLYKHRWDIEKVFDELKTKLEEKRSWASSKEAKTSHAHFLSLTHNLMLLLEEYLQSEESMRDEVEPRKREIRERRQQEKRKGFRKDLKPSFINSFFTRATQRTVRFIRWLRECLSKKLRYREALHELTEVWKCKIH